MEPLDGHLDLPMVVRAFGQSKSIRVPLPLDQPDGVTVTVVEAAAPTSSRRACCRRGAG